MKKMTATILAIVMLGMAMVGCQDNVPKPSPDNLDGGTGLTREQKQKDVDYLMDMLATNYVYQDILPGSPSVLFDSEKTECKDIKKKLVNTKTDLEYLQQLSSFLNSLGNPHTGVEREAQSYDFLIDKPCDFNTYSQYVDLWNAVAPYKDKLPFVYNSRNKENKPVVIYSYISDIVAGDIVISVNGKELKEFVKEYLYIDSPDEMKIKLVDTSGKEKNVNVKKEQIIQGAISPNIHDRAMFQSLPENDTAYLYLSNFSSDNLKYFYEFTEKAADCKNIIIDVRDNYGGNYDTTEAVSAYVAKLPKRSLLNINYKWQSVFLKDTMDLKYYYGLPYILWELKNHDFNNEKYDVYNVMKTVYANYDYTPCDENANIYILENEVTYSAPCIFLQDISSSNLDYVTIVGKPSNGAGSMSCLYTMLPESKLIVRISNEMLVDENGGIDEIDGIKPDYDIDSASVAEMAKFYSENPEGIFFTSEYDPQFKKVMELIEQSGK